jgi:hypothetical protein
VSIDLSCFFQVFSKRSGFGRSTFLQLRHLKVSHPDLYNSCVKDQLENPDLPHAVDSAHPIWNFFENLNQDDVSKSARCTDCLEIFPFSETENAKNLEAHLRAEHVQNQESYESFCTGNFRC